MSEVVANAQGYVMLGLFLLTLVTISIDEIRFVRRYQ